MEVVARERPPPPPSTRGPPMSISVAQLPPPPTLMKIPQPQPPIRLLSTTNTPGSSDSAAITRCDLMWAASNNSAGEAFTPVQGCEIHPFVIIRDKDNHGHDDDDLEALKHTGIRMHYRWRRGPARAVCFFHPHRTATSQCTITLRCFCSYHCFDRGHKQLRRFYASGGKWSLPRQPNEFTYGVPCKPIPPGDIDAVRETDETHYRLLRQAGLVVDPDQETWHIVSYSRNFSPRKEDVGHQLKFECCLIYDPSNSTGSSPESSSIPPRPSEALVRVITSAHDQTSLTTSTSHTDQAARPHNASGPRSSPVVSTTSSDPRKGPLSLNQSISTNDVAEQRFWAEFDRRKVGPPPHVPDMYRAVSTSCVVPQAPFSDAREIMPVGLLALFSAPPSTPQRVIPAGSPLARALGIGLANKRSRIQQQGLGISSYIFQNDPCSRLSNRYAHQKAAQTPSIVERRETLLTDNAFATWSRPTHQDSVKIPAVIKAKHHSGRIAEQGRIRGTLSGPKLNVSDPGGCGESFTVMTWNVLADIYASVDAYPYCEPYVLAWNYRRERLLHEMLAYSPDVICLQEVQADHFEEFFAPALLRKGYEGLYKHKTSRVFRGSGKHRGGKFVCDGCATFYKIPKFRLVDHFGIEFARVTPPNARAFDSKSDKRLNKDNVALVMCLEQIIVASSNGRTAGGKLKGPAGPTSLESAAGAHANLPNVTTSIRRLVVANTHILANPEAPDVKIWQANTLTTVLTDYMEKSLTFHRVEGSSRVPGLVICGDFNSTPESAVYQLVTAGACDARHEELQSSDVYKWLHEIELGHGLNLRSSYGAASYMRMEAEKALAHSGGGSQGNTQQPYVLSHPNHEPEFTNYTHQYVGCLDYIFFDDRYLKLTGTLDLVKELTLLEEAQALQLSDWALPSPQRPSDHLPLLSRFEWMR